MPARGRADAELERVAGPVVEAGQLHSAVVGGDVRDADLEVDRGRQHVAEVVVGVLPDEVDPAGRPDDPDLGPVRRRRRVGGDERGDERIGFELRRRQHPRSVLPWHDGGMTDRRVR